MNNWYDRIVGSFMQPQQQVSNGPVFQNPIQKAQYIYRAMTNPGAFVKEQFPDVPDEIMNDPNRVLQYIQQSRGISNDQLNQIVNQYPRR